MLFRSWAVQPAGLGSAIRLRDGHRGEVTLDSQRQLAVRIEPLLAGRRLGVVGAPELLVLTRRANHLPFVSWDARAWAYYRTSAHESLDACWRRLLSELQPDRVHVIVDGRIVDSGGPELAARLEAEGYERYESAQASS